MNIFIFGRFQARAECEAEFREALHKVVLASREEPGCLEIHGFVSVRDPRLFFMHSRWADQASFDAHAELPHTLEFLKQTDTLLERPREVTRTAVFV